MTPESAVSYNMVNSDGVTKEEIPLERPQKVIDLDSEYMVLAKSFAYCYEVEGCNEYAGDSDLAEETYVVNKKTGSIWLLPENYYPVPGSIKFRDNGISKKLFMVVHGGDSLPRLKGTRNYDENTEDGHYSIDRKAILLSIDLSNPEKPEARKMSPGHLEVRTYKVDGYGNAVFIALDKKISNSEFAYALVPNGVTPRIERLSDSMIKKLGFHSPWDVLANYNDRILEGNKELYLLKSYTSFHKDSEQKQSPVSKLIFNIDPRKDIIESIDYEVNLERTDVIDDYGNFYLNMDTENVKLIQLSNTAIFLSLGHTIVLRDGKVEILSFDIQDRVVPSYTVDGDQLYFSDNTNLLKLNLSSLEVAKYALPYSGAVLNLSKQDDIVNLIIYNSGLGAQASITFNQLTENFKILEVLEGDYFASVFDLIRIDSSKD